METLQITNGAPSAAPPQPERVKTLASRKKRSLRKNIVFYALLSLVGVFMILPTVVMVLSSFKTYDEYYSLQFLSLIHIFPARACRGESGLIGDGIEPGQPRVGDAVSYTHLR